MAKLSLPQVCLVTIAAPSSCALQTSFSRRRRRPQRRRTKRCMTLTGSHRRSLRQITPTVPTLSLTSHRFPSPLRVGHSSLSLGVRYAGDRAFLVPSTLPSVPSLPISPAQVRHVAHSSESSLICIDASVFGTANLNFSTFTLMLERALCFV